MNQEIIVIDGVRYYADRPNSCRGCFFWKNRKAGCSLKKENCYYLAESPKKTSPCVGCCYGPCVSFCMKKCVNEVFGTKMVVPGSILTFFSFLRILCSTTALKSCQPMRRFSIASC